MGGAERIREQKKASERRAAQRLADALNSARAADYSCDPGGDPPDFVLRSPTARCPEQRVEVTSFPIGEYWNRDDNGHLARFRENLQEWVKRCYPLGFLFSVQAAEHLRRNGISEAELKAFLHSLDEASRDLPINHAAEHLQEKLPAPLSKKFVLILVVNSGRDVTSELWTPMEHEQPRTGLWVWEAVAKKARDYGGRSNCDILALDGFLTEEQVSDARRMLAERQTPFGEIWLVGKFNEPLQLK